MCSGSFWPENSGNVVVSLLGIFLDWNFVVIANSENHVFQD